MKKIVKAGFSVVVLVAGIVWLSTSVEAVPKRSASSLRYCLLDDTYKVVKRECRLLQEAVLEQVGTESQPQISEQTNVVNENQEAPVNEASPMNDYCPQPQDGTGYHHGANQLGGNGRHDRNSQSRGNGLQDGSGAGGQRGHNAGSCLR